MKKIKLSSIKLLLFIILYSSYFVLVEAREIKANLAWFNVTKLSFRVNGIVAGLYVKPGDYVKEKQKLINLDQREYRDNVLLTKSLLKSRKSELDEAKRELDRALELFDRTVLSEHELQTVKNNFISSETRYITANKNWLKAKRDLEFSNITAPFNAVVLELALNKNETVISSFNVLPVITIAEADKMSANFKLTANEVLKLKTGIEVDVKINGIEYKGTVYFPSLLVKENLYPVSVLLSIPNGTVRAGMEAVVNLP